MGLFRESNNPIVSTLDGSASVWDFIVSTLIPAILPCAPLNQLMYFISINYAHHSILVIHKSSCITSHMARSHKIDLLIRSEDWTPYKDLTMLTPALFFLPYLLHSM